MPLPKEPPESDIWSALTEASFGPKPTPLRRARTIKRINETRYRAKRHQHMVCKGRFCRSLFSSRENVEPVRRCSNLRIIPTKDHRSPPDIIRKTTGYTLAFIPCFGSTLNRPRLPDFGHLTSYFWQTPCLLDCDCDSANKNTNSPGNSLSCPG